MRRLFLMSVILPGLFLHLSAQEKWENLFNGENFDNWEVLNGNAEYTIEGDEIVGTSRLNTPNTFLATKRTYSDFILEFEVKVDPTLNSGVQIRSLSDPSYRDGRVHGYQVEIDPSKRAWSGGIYDEARRGWVYALGRNPKGQQAFNVTGWNKYRVEAVGPSIRIWINGVNTANLLDDMTPAGFIGLQVHGINNEVQDGKEIRWRNIRITEESPDRYRWEMDPEVEEVNLIPNTISEWEARKGWRLLWDGKTDDGWMSAGKSDFPDQAWTMEDGELTIRANSGGMKGDGGDIITKEKFTDFEMTFEFRITEGANSGVKYLVNPHLKSGKGGAVGLEYQVLDDKRHPDAKQGVNGNRTVASLYDIIPSYNMTEDSDNKRFKGPGEWNHGRILVRNNHAEHWLNGLKMVEYELKTPMFRALIDNSKFHNQPEFGEWDRGYILLQDHNDEVSFRSLKIREF